MGRFAYCLANNTVPNALGNQLGSIDGVELVLRPRQKVLNRFFRSAKNLRDFPVRFSGGAPVDDFPFSLRDR